MRSSSGASLVVDSSALVELLLTQPKASAVRTALRAADAAAPDLVNLEVLSTFRRMARGGVLTSERAAKAVRALARLPVRRLQTLALLEEIWSLRHNLTPYDAAYVAAARKLGCPLLTADGRLARAPGLGVAVVSV